MIAPFGIRPKGTLLARMLPLAQALARRGHQLTIVAPPLQNPADAGTRVNHGGVPVIHTALAKGPGSVLAQSASLLRAALAESPDLLHLFKPKGYGGLAALAARIARPSLPLVLDSDDWEGAGGWNELLPYPAPAKALFAWQERDLPRRAAAITVASRTLESLVWSMGVPPDRVFYLPNGVNGLQNEINSVSASSYHGSSKPAFLSSKTVNSKFEIANPTLLLYTRFWELDLHELAAALAGLHSARPAARLLLVGRGERGEERQLRELAERAGFAGMLDERGWLAPEDIPATLAEAQIALVPVRDTLINRARCSAKLLELMGAGLAIVASDVGENRSFIEHGRSGLLVPPGDAGALATAALRLLDDPTLRGELAAQALAAAQRFSWDTLALTVEAAYCVALGQN